MNKFSSRSVRQSVLVWCVALSCLGVVSCFRTLDPSKIPCSENTQCPSLYSCSKPANQTTGTCIPKSGKEDAGIPITGTDGASKTDGSGGTDGTRASGGAGGSRVGGGQGDASRGGTGGSVTPDAPVGTGDDVPTSGGATCANDTECSGGYCVLGICCNTPCDGQCESCIEAGSVGTCTAVKGMPASGRAACGGSGACKGECDGNNRRTCTYPDSTTICTAARCEGGKVTTAAVCDSVGSCTTAASIDCPNAQCAADGSAKCATACTTASCGETAYCDTTGACLPLKAPGVSCSAAGQCTSGFCVDGFCCDGKCDGQCESCKEAGSVGKCKSVKGSPLATRTACGGDGVCKGQCDGTNGKACIFPNGSVECSPASCAEGKATTASVCNGSGACTTANTNPCSSNLCGTGGKCADSCTENSCTAGKYCDSTGTCAATLANGKGCSAGTQCTYGNCVDGVCCDSKCDGQCESCKQTGYVGTCKAVKGDPVAPRTGCAGTAPCKGQCDGVTGAACQFPGGSTSCTAAKCAAGKLTTATACDSKGACTSSTIRDCASTLCSSDGLSCADTCAGLTCGTGNYCNGTSCVPKKDPGAACNDGVECKSTFCADKVCCNAACTERCKACNSSGVCTAVSGAVRHGTPCATDGTTCGGTCDGTHDDCFYPLNVSCGSTAACNAQMTMLSSSSCNGAGVCAAGSTNCQAAGQYCDSTTTSCKAKLTTAGAACSLPVQCNSGNCDANHCCPAGQKWCGSSCIDTSTSKTNCGSCGNACSSVESCSGGICSCNASLFCTGGTDRCGVWDFSSGVQGWSVSEPAIASVSMVNGKLAVHVTYDPSSGYSYPQVRLSICPSGVTSTNGYTLSATVRFNYQLTTGLATPNLVRLWGSDGRPNVVQTLTDPVGYPAPSPTYTLSGPLSKDVNMIGLDFGLNQYFSGDILVDDVKLTPP